MRQYATGDQVLLFLAYAQTTATVALFGRVR